MTSSGVQLTMGLEISKSSRFSLRYHHHDGSLSCRGPARSGVQLPLVAARTETAPPLHRADAAPSSCPSSSRSASMSRPVQAHSPSPRHAGQIECCECVDKAECHVRGVAQVLHQSASGAYCHRGLARAGRRMPKWRRLANFGMTLNRQRVTSQPTLRIRESTEMSSAVAWHCAALKWIEWAVGDDKV